MTFRTWKGGTEGSSLLCFVSRNLRCRILPKNILQAGFGCGEDVETRRKHTQKWSYGRDWLRFSSFSNPPHVGLTCHQWHHHSYGIFSKCKFLDHHHSYGIFSMCKFLDKKTCKFFQKKSKNIYIFKKNCAKFCLFNFFLK